MSKLFSLRLKEDNRMILSFLNVKLKIKRDFFKAAVFDCLLKELEGDNIISFPWDELFSKYFSSKNMKKVIKNLKKDLDDVSIEYIDKFMELAQYWHYHCNKNIYTNEDIKTIEANKEFLKTFKQPFKDILTIDPYFYSNIYGLYDLEKDVFDKIDGKIIIDGGAANGDTALVFHKYFPNSRIDAYDPHNENISTMHKFLSVDDCNKKICPIWMGLGDKKETIEIENQMTPVDCIDNIYLNVQDGQDERNEKREQKVGLIKLDVEGMETNIIMGAKEILKKDKPVLAIAIYHTPWDFFELKDKIKKINPEYKFKIRRSQMILPQADLVLIAY